MSIESKKIPATPESGWPCAFCKDSGIHDIAGELQFCTCEEGKARKLRDPKCIEEFKESIARLRAKGLMT